jgi:threonine/homoserine/homoserine lactone efflux protein
VLSLEQIAAFGLASVLLTLLPGPTVLFVVGRSLALGRRAGLWTVVGNTLGLLPAVAAVALGVGAVVAGSAVAFTIVKIAGAAYLIWLGAQALRGRGEDADGADGAPRRTLRIVADGFLVGATNPKALVFLAAVLPQFVDRSAGAVSGQLLALGLVFMAVALVSDGGYALAAGTARTWFGRDPDRLVGMRRAGGLMMIGLGGSLALTGQR